VFISSQFIEAAADDEVHSTDAPTAAYEIARSMSEAAIFMNGSAQRSCNMLDVSIPPSADRRRGRFQRARRLSLRRPANDDGAAARAIRQSFVQDALDGTGAATALHPAAKAAVDLVRGQRLRSSSRHHVPYLVVA
jgi:hypothetical protein